MGATGNSGQSSGDHYHLEVYEDTKYDVATRDKTWRHIFDVFAINNVKTIINDWDYDWKTSDYVDGEGGGETPSKDNNKKRITMMLLSDALNGWKL
jgi:murein DD-endopeptidase MepM/ murein hydrolase activator NlpD